jgi:hypothetical protein
MSGQINDVTMQEDEVKLRQCNVKNVCSYKMLNVAYHCVYEIKEGFRDEWIHLKLG